jgi:probable rRNA maturation factor
MVRLEVQNATTVAAYLPDEESLARWAEAAGGTEPSEVLVRLVDEQESAELNSNYRHKKGPTNILSFSFEVPEGIPNDYLGDLVICAGVVEREAKEQAKPLDAHWAHMVVHGLLHLRGYDHVDEADAAAMEAEEVAILAGLGFPDPYFDNEAVR